MDSILERHLKRVLTQNASIRVPEKNKKITEKTSEPDPILSKHLSKIFKENDEISKEFKAVAEIKKKNEDVLEIFSTLIEHKLKEPIQNIPEIQSEKPNVIPETNLENEIEEPIIEEQTEEEQTEEEPLEDFSIDHLISGNPEVSVIDTYKQATNAKSGTEFNIIHGPEPEPKTAENIYVKTIKDSESSAPEPVNDDNAFFKFLDKHKDDSRVKNFFNYHSETMKKELFSITEKFSKAHKLWLAESGGGGGGYNSSSSSKVVKTIGNGIDTDYVIEHGLQTKDLVITVYDTFTDEIVICSAKNISPDTTLISFQDPLPENSLRVVIIA